MDLPLAVRDVVDTVGAGVLDDPDSFRGVLDDVLDESAAEAGEVNLLVDAVRFGCFDQLLRLLESDADPVLAVTTVGAGLARLRGGADPRAASWACAVLGFAVRRVPADVVRDLASHVPPADVAGARPQPVPTAVLPDPVADAPPVTADGSSRSRPGRRLALRLGAIGVGVVGAGLVMFFALDGRTTPDPADDTTRASGDASGAGIEAQCWNGESAAAVAECSSPTDVAGLRWVFPAWDETDCVPEGAGHASKVVERFCSIQLEGGGDGQVHYSQWRDRGRMFDHYEAERLGRNLEVGRSDLVAFAVEGNDQLQKVVVFYRDEDAPFAVTVYADSRANLYAAVGRLLIRPFDQLRGLGPGEDELSTSLVEPSAAPS